MKVFYFKSIFLIVVLCFSMTGLIGCSNASATKLEPPAGGYPPAPPNLMQATLKKMDETPFKLEDYKGKVILVNVWATWCGPCRQEIPELIDLQNSHQSKGFEIIGLNLDSSEDSNEIKTFEKEMKINYLIARGEEKLFGEFEKVSQRPAIPQSFLINRDGKLMGVFVGGGKALKRLIESVNKVMAE